MFENIDVIFSDLFFTLISPNYNDFDNENEILGISKEKWEKYAEDEKLYYQRAIGDKGE